MSETEEMMAPAQAPPNPLLRPWQTPFETPPFAEIAPEHFLPAFEQAFADHAAEIAAIEHDPSAPDFANTITALERSGKLLSKVSAVFYDLVSAHSNPALLEIDKEVSLRMARHWNPIMMNAVLFGRIALLRENRVWGPRERLIGPALTLSPLMLGLKLFAILAGSALVAAVGEGSCFCACPTLSFLRVGLSCGECGSTV